ncbi:hypothetical protein LG943_05855 [Streptomonospora sp. S1-112]|uniref:Uncharacterized protein n=1 Tax=Streptomonospora mangrovi TaxID=2883123 RepID=A0A9X3NKM9_9ACTN|nr:hypothetical protein [Streptomonospora mangrovi]MDA0563853.1 hypothetical protein [Streptomonospora mangrovi]
MTIPDTRIPAVVALAGAGASAVVAVAAAWWGLLWLTLLLALAGGALLLWRREEPAFGGGPLSGTTWTTDDPPPPMPAAHEEPEEPRTPRRTHLTKVPLPSAHPEYDVLLSAVVNWYPDRDTRPGADGRAKTLVVERAAGLTRREPPEEFAVTGHRLAAELGEPARSGADGSEVWAEEVRLELREEDAARLKRIRDFRKDEEIRKLERAAERSLRDYLRSDMLSDPGQAVLWWLSRDPDRIHETANEIGTLSLLSAAASGTEIPRLYRDLAGEGGGAEAPGTGWPGAWQAGAHTGGGNGQATLFGDDRLGGAAAGACAEAAPEPGGGGGGGGGAGGGGGEADAADDVPERAAEAFIYLLSGPGGRMDRPVAVHVAAEMLKEAGRVDLAERLKPVPGAADTGAAAMPEEDRTPSDEDRAAPGEETTGPPPPDRRTGAGPDRPWPDFPADDGPSPNGSPNGRPAPQAEPGGTVAQYPADGGAGAGRPAPPERGWTTGPEGWFGPMAPGSTPAQDGPGAGSAPTAPEAQPPQGRDGSQDREDRQGGDRGAAPEGYGPAEYGRADAPGERPERPRQPGVPEPPDEEPGRG